MAIDLGFDESGGGDTLLVSMQLSITEQAKKLKRKWRKRLRDDNLPFFHSKDFGNYSGGIFRKLERKQRNDLLRDLGKLSRQHLYIGMTAKVTKSRYEQKTTPAFRSRWGSPYTFSIQMLVVGAYMLAEHMHLKPEFNILLEAGHASAGGAIASLNDTKRAGMGFAIPTRIINVGLAAKADHPILQAADMLGYSEWQRINNADMEIYNEMHGEGMLFLPEYLDFDEAMVDVIVKGAERWMQERKLWGQRKYPPQTLKMETEQMGTPNTQIFGTTDGESCEQQKPSIEQKS